MAKKRKRKFTEDFIEKWKETTTEDERSKTRRILKKQERQLRKDPKNANLWFARGELLRSIDEHEKALICYEAVIRLEPDHKVVYNARGKALEALGRKDEAVESYQKALELTEEAEEELKPKEEELEEIAAEELQQLIGDVTSPERIEKIAEGIRLPREKIEEPKEEVEEVEEYFECPMCGELLDVDETGCPMCGAEFVEEVDKEKIMERLESLESEIMEEEEVELTPLEDSLRRKLEKWRREGYNVLPLENIMRREPDRARSAAFRFEENLKKVEILRESLKSLPETGYEEEIEKIELMLRSPYKIWAIEAEMERLWQRVEVDEKERREAAPPAEVPTPPPPEEEGPPRAPPSEGLINGRRRAIVPPGRVNGLVNGLKTTRSGLTNGLTNGLGMTNGLSSYRFRREEIRGRWKLFLPIMVTVLLLASTLFLAVERVDNGRITVDGNIEDWEGMPVMESRQSSLLNPNIDVVETSVYDDSGFLTFYVQVVDTILQGNGDNLLDTIFIFIDLDRSEATGYGIEGLGADRMIEVFGSANSITQAIMYEYDPAASSDNWNGWFKPRTIKAAADSSNLEIEVDWDILSANVLPIDALIASHGYDGDQDMADVVVSNVGGSLEVVEESYLEDWVISGMDNTLLRMIMTAHQTDIQIAQITIEIIGSASPDEISAVKLLDGNLDTLEISDPSRIVTFDTDLMIPEGSSETYYVAIDSTSASQNTVGARVQRPSDIRTENASVTLRMGKPRNGIGLGYLGSIKPGYSIDGAFFDWIGTPDPQGDVSNNNPNIDIVNYSSANGTDTAFFFVEVQGQMLKGTAIPYVAREIQPVQFVDSDMDTVPDDVDGPNGTNICRYDFDNDGIADALEGGDVDSDGVTDYPAGSDWYLNTTIPDTFLPEYGGRVVSRYIGPVQKPSRPGEDTLRAYIDTEPGVGYLLDRDTGFYADYLLEIVGKNGEPLIAGFLSFNGSSPGHWSWIHSRTPKIGKDSSKLEASVDLTSLPIGPMFDVRFRIRDWSGCYDNNSGTRFATRGDFGEYDYISKGSFNAYFTKHTGSVKFEKDEYHFSWDLPDSIIGVSSQTKETLGVLLDSHLDLDEYQANYERAFDGINGSITYEFLDRTLKENIVLHSPLNLDSHLDFIEIAFDIDYSDNLIPFLEGNLSQAGVLTRNLTFYHLNERAISLMAPYAHDSTNRRLDCSYLFPPSENELKIVCNAQWFSGADYPVVIDPSVSYTLEDDSYATDGANLGRSVAIGDFDGDGYADVVSGAPFSSYGSLTFRGLAHIFYGPFSADDSSPDVTILGANSWDRLGVAVAAGKINNDEYWDAVVSQIGTEPTYVYYGSSSGIDTTPDVTISTQGGGFGEGLAVCNVDNSNDDDVLVGAPSTTGGGRVYIYQSPLSATELTADDVLAPLNDTGGKFGQRLACGKIDNDNYHDVIVSEPEADILGGSDINGRVAFFKGSEIDFTGGENTPDSVLEYRQTKEMFGTDVAVGKIDSDSYDDLIVGAQYNDQGGTNNGRAYIYLAESDGSGIANNSSPDVEIAGQSTGETFGYAVYAGNIMGDSAGDVAVGAPCANETGTSMGAVYVFEDPVNDNSAYDDKIIGSQDSEYFGWSLDGGKFSNDDILVLAIGAPSWDDGVQLNEGRIVVWLIPEFPSEVILIAVGIFIPIAVACRRRII